jgi:hypothetical protein
VIIVTRTQRSIVSGQEIKTAISKIVLFQQRPTARLIDLDSWHVLDNGVKNIILT